MNKTNKLYLPPKRADWTGRNSGKQEYIHEKIECISLDNKSLKSLVKSNGHSLLGYAGDEGVKRNMGRTGAAKGPEAIRKALGRMANHLPKGTQLIDAGTVKCQGKQMEAAHEEVGNRVAKLLELGTYTILLGGGHDLAYAHYLGIKKFLAQVKPKPKLGIINLDAHFDLRTLENGKGHSGSPFLQIAEDLGEDNFHYLCLGIQTASNIPHLFQTARKWNVRYLPVEDYSLHCWNIVEAQLHRFLDEMDAIYLSIDLDGFHSGIAPGVSAVSPFGFDWAIAKKTIRYIKDSSKLLSADIVEFNPQYDIEGVTAKLAAGIVLELAS